MEAFCKSCNSIQEVEKADEDGEDVFCLSCGETFPLVVEGFSGAETNDDDKFAHFKVAKVMKVDRIPKTKDLRLCLVDVIGTDDETKYIPVVTNAKYIEEGWRVVVACEKAIVPAGASVGQETDAFEVIKMNVHGVESRGMLCDAPSLRWTGGAKGIVQQMPDTFAIGDRPPQNRPRA
jgi:tRNA-binding EMAP/Myf-like protein